MDKGAVISECGKYRYQLWRIWDETLPLVLWIMHNPSTADADVDDPTIRRCINFTKSWGYGGLYVGNLSAFRATNPKDVPKESFFTSFNLESIDEMIVKTMITVLAMGNPIGSHKFTIDTEKGEYYYLKLTKSGNPCHPLYLRSDLKPVLFTGGNIT